ncbi:MAG TPA: hypothetical protein VFB46_00180 [Gemmatimonadaceae bacterium]|nr:hypothetical protein [Gemmatimonadaceae bacterium]
MTAVQRALIALAAGAALGTFTRCTSRGTPDEEVQVSSRKIEDVLATHTDSLMSLPGVVGTAIGSCDGSPCIRVLVSDSISASRRVIPSRLEGYTVRVELTGPIRALEDSPKSPPK